MGLLDVNRSALVVIDMQGKLMEMAYRSAKVISGTKRLMKMAEIFRRPVLLTEQYPKGLGVTHPEIRAVYDDLTTEKRFLEKTSFGCCGDPGFLAVLDELLPAWPIEQRQIVIAGIETHICVMQTAIELLAAGYQVHVCWDCVSGRGEEYRANALERMRQAGASITNHESVGFEWARNKNHQRFREMNELLRPGQP